MRTRTWPSDRGASGNCTVRVVSSWSLRTWNWVVVMGRFTMRKRVPGWCTGSACPVVTRVAGPAPECPPFPKCGPLCENRCMNASNTTELMNTLGSQAKAASA
ncbi:hypothetical protein Y695_03666 [Hydrogenophaga sp. T4]|nr:hypothetical protein Y695_03666 [Hydrogenophaga sp. T4]